MREMYHDVIKVGRGIQNKPWARQSKWKRMTVPSYEEIVEVAKSFTIDREAALFCLCYLTAGRISEIMAKQFLLKRKYEKVENIDGKGKHKFVAVSTEKIAHDYPGIRRRDFQEDYIEGLKVLVISIENRKNETIQRKYCPIPIEKEEELINIIYKYINKLDYDTHLFYNNERKKPYSIKWAENVINKTGMNPHFLRDIRATHLAQNYNFTEYHLIAFMGWTDGRPASRYVIRNWKKIVKNYS